MEHPSQARNLILMSSAGINKTDKCTYLVNATAMIIIFPKGKKQIIIFRLVFSDSYMCLKYVYTYA